MDVNKKCSRAASFKLEISGNENIKGSIIGSLQRMKSEVTQRYNNKVNNAKVLQLALDHKLVYFGYDIYMHIPQYCIWIQYNIFQHQMHQ